MKLVSNDNISFKVNISDIGDFDKALLAYNLTSSCSCVEGS